MRGRRTARGFGAAFARVALMTMLFLMLILFGAFVPAAGQSTASLVAQGLAVPMEDLLPSPYADPAEAVRLLDELRAREPERLDLHLAAARELTALGITDPTKERRMEWLRTAEAAARRAIELDPGSAEARYWLAAVLGLVADQSGGLSKISTARAAHEQVVAALALDPAHGGAHHILGRMHSGVLRLGRLNRLIARGLGLGALLGQASWQSAEEHLRIALATDPDPFVHTTELAKLLARRGGESEATTLLEHLVADPARHVLDAHYQEEARTLLASLTVP